MNGLTPTVKVFLQRLRVKTSTHIEMTQLTCLFSYAKIATLTQVAIKKPFGKLANKELRKARSAAHRAFDPLWKFGDMEIKEAYTWLADTLGINSSDCHIGMFDVPTCEDVEMHSLAKQEDDHGFY